MRIRRVFEDFAKYPCIPYRDLWKMGLCLYFMLGREIPLETLSQVPACGSIEVSKSSRDNEDDGTFCFCYQL